MAWLPAFVLCSAITASIQLPGIARHLNEDFYKESRKENARNFFQHHLVNGKISMDESAIIELMHLGQNKNLKAQKGTDQERYRNNSNSIAINNNDEKNNTGTQSQSDSKDSFTEIKNMNVSIAASEKGIQSFMKTFLKEDEWFLNRKGEFNTRLPKYLYGILPISAFPEELSGPQETIEVKKEKLKNPGYPVTQKTSQPTHIAGPMPYPQATYATEFDLPFFD